METNWRYLRKSLTFGRWYVLPVEHLSVPGFSNNMVAVAVQAFVVLPLSTFSSRFFSNIVYGWISAARPRSFWTSVIQRLSSRRLLVEHCFFLMSEIFTLTFACAR